MLRVYNYSVSTTVRYVLYVLRLLWYTFTTIERYVVLTGKHVDVGSIRDGEDVRWDFITPLSSVQFGTPVCVYRETFVGVDGHAEEAGVGLKIMTHIFKLTMSLKTNRVGAQRYGTSAQSTVTECHYSPFSWKHIISDCCKYVMYLILVICNIFWNSFFVFKCIFLWDITLKGSSF